MRPTSFIQTLRLIADYMDVSDELITEMAVERGSPYRPGTGEGGLAQDDLRSLACWLVAHPDCTYREMGAYFLGLGANTGP